MKRTMKLVLLGVALLLAATSSVWAQETQPIAHYGEAGDGVPDYVRNLLPEGFFTKNLTKDIVGGENYVGALDLSPSNPDLFGASHPFSLANTFVFLENVNDDVADVVISAEYGNGKRVENYLVHLAGGERRSIDLSGLEPGPSLHLVSMLPFSASVSFEGGDVRAKATRQDIGPTLRRAIGVNDAAGDSSGLSKSSSACGPLQKDVKICNAGTTDCVMARANRDYYPHLFRPQYRAIAFISYPIGTAFHCPINDHIFSVSTCSAGSYKTKRCDGTPYRHIWNGLDNTFNSCTPSTANCTSGCVGSWDVTCY